MPGTDLHWPVILCKTVNPETFVTWASTGMTALILPFMTSNVTRYAAAYVTVGEPRHKTTTYDHRTIMLSEHASVSNPDFRFPTCYLQMSVSRTGGLTFDKGTCIFCQSGDYDQNTIINAEFTVGYYNNIVSCLFVCLFVCFFSCVTNTTSELLAFKLKAHRCQKQHLYCNNVQGNMCMYSLL